MQVACVQFDIAWEDMHANYASVRSLLGAAGLPPGSLAILPEMFATGFSMDVDAASDDPDRETQQVLADFACRMGIYLLGGVVSRAPDGRGYNEAVACDPSGAIVARYQKMHPFALAGEAEHYVAGSKIVLFPWHSFIVCPLICYDLRFPELFRAAVRQGANFFTVIANWPTTREEHWVKLLQARAIENQAYVAGINRTGKDPRYTYGGRSLIIDPHGEILADAGASPGVIRAETEFDAMQAYRRDFPALADMRNDLFR